jgi:hypothetical protein
MKKHFIHYKPVITKLPIKFNQFFQIKIIKLKDENNKMGAILAVGG